MKRLNYYQVHKNKKPKVKKQNKYINLSVPYIAINKAMSINRVHQILSQQTDRRNKAIEILKETMFNFNAVNRILIQERQRKFNLTGRYT